MNYSLPSITTPVLQQAADDLILTITDDTMIRLTSANSMESSYHHATYLCVPSNITISHLFECAFRSYQLLSNCRCILSLIIILSNVTGLGLGNLCISVTIDWKRGWFYVKYYILTQLEISSVRSETIYY